MNEYLTLGALSGIVAFMGVFIKIAWNISKNLATIVAHMEHFDGKIKTHEIKLGEHDNVLVEHGKLLVAHDTILRQRELN